MRTLQKKYNTHFYGKTTVARALRTCAAVFGLFGVLSFAPSHSQAAITFGSVTGASRIEIPQASTTVPIVRPIIYAGFAGTCSPAPTSNTETCNSCDGSGRKPCNVTNAYPSLRLTVRLDMGRTDLTYNLIKGKLGSVELSFSVAPIITGSVAEIYIPWSDLCSAVVGGDAACTKPIPSTTLYLGYQAAGETAPTYFEMQVVSRYIDVTDAALQTFQICSLSNDPNANQGFCDYKVKPGDGKVYLDDSRLTVASAFPATGATGVNYQDILFFYKSTEGSTPAATLAAITNTSDMLSLNVSSTEKPPVADNRIDGLTNGIQYCFVMANRDVTGNIAYFAPVDSGTLPYVAEADVCATPDEVFGLLDDKKCFIATAAFGSDMAPEVQSFREFRNKFLLTSSLGKDFVHFYYEHSPKYANIIAKNDFLRASVRAALWPVLGFAKLSVAVGFIPAFMGLMMLMGLASTAVVQVRRSRKVS